MLKLRSAAALAAGLLISSLTCALAAPPPPGMIHVRGSIVSVHGRDLNVLADGKTVHVLLPAKGGIASVLPSSRAAIKDGTFLGIASVPGMHGMQRAREVVVFPNSARGTGEGSYPWDLPGGKMGHSKMTNGTVKSSKMTNGMAMHSKMTNGTVHGAAASSVTLTYKSGSGMGSQHITLPPGIPVVTFGPGSRGLLKPGAHVFVMGKKAANGTVDAARVMVGKNGLVPPM